MTNIPAATSVLSAATPPSGASPETKQQLAVLVERQAHLWKADVSGSWVAMPADVQGAPFVLVARDSEGTRRGKEVLKSFVGPHIASIDESACRPDGASQTLRTLQTLGLHEVYGIRVASDSFDAATRAIDLLVSVRTGAPDLTRQAPPALAFLLRDFRLAVQQRDASSSADLLAQLEALGQLSAENLRFLKIERLASLGRWQEIVALPGFDDLTRARRPRRISEQLMEAVWRAYVEGDDGVATAAAAVARFEQQDLRHRFSALLRSVDTPGRPRARRLVAVFAVTADLERLQRLYDTAIADETAFLDELSRTQTAAPAGPERGPAAATISDLAAAGDWQGVLSSAEADADNPAAVEAAVRAAFELEDEWLARRAMRLVEGLGRERLPATPGFQRVLRIVEATALDACESWSDWLARVARPQPWPDAADVARNNAADWPASALEPQAQGESAASLMLEAQGGPNVAQLVSALDLLCKLGAELVALNSMSPYVPAVMLLVSEQDNPSRQVREAFRALLEAVLDSGPNAPAYEQYLLVLAGLWSRVSSPAALDWALDTIDLLATFPCPVPEPREDYVRSVVAWAHQHPQQVTRHQALALAAMSASLNVEAGLGALTASEATEEQGRDLWSLLANCRVGVYSLLPNVGQRLQNRLQEHEASAMVEQNADTVSTPALRALATGSDFMIVDTWHATHSATQAIDDVLPRSDQILPRGGGLMSMISALAARLESLA